MRWLVGVCAVSAVLCAFIAVRLVTGSQATWTMAGQVKDQMASQSQMLTRLQIAVEAWQQASAQSTQMTERMAQTYVELMTEATKRLQAEQQRYLRVAYPSQSRWFALEDRIHELEDWQAKHPQ